MKEPNSVETHKIATLQEELRKIFADCAVITTINASELPGKEIFSINVTNPEVWKSAKKEEELLKLFGELCFITFEPREGGDAYNLDNPEIKARAVSDLAEIKECQKIFVVAEKGKASGFAGSLITQKDNLRMSILSLIVVDPAKRGGPIARFLNERFLAQEGMDGYGAITHAPAEIKSLVSQGEKLGRISYFCGQRGGEWGKKGSDEEQARMQVLDAMVRDNYAREYGERCISDTPGYCGIKKLNKPGVIDPIPPVQENELKFREGDPIGQTFREGLLKMNERNHPHTIYGIYVSF